MKNKLTLLTEIFLAYHALFFAVSSFIHNLAGNNAEWFSRFFLSIVCVGFLYLGRVLQENKTL